MIRIRFNNVGRTETFTLPVGAVEVMVTGDMLFAVDKDRQLEVIARRLDDASWSVMTPSGTKAFTAFDFYTEEDFKAGREFHKLIQKRLGVHDIELPDGFTGEECFFCHGTWGGEKHCSCPPIVDPENSTPEEVEQKCFESDEMIIYDPGISCCSRFFVDPFDEYGDDFRNWMKTEAGREWLKKVNREDLLKLVEN